QKRSRVSLTSTAFSVFVFRSRCPWSNIIVSHSLAAGWGQLYIFGKLGVVDLSINRAAFQQFLVHATGHNLALLQHEDDVGVEYSADTLGDDEAGAPFHQPIQRLLNLILGLQVHAAGGVVQN